MIKAPSYSQFQALIVFHLLLVEFRCQYPMIPKVGGALPFLPSHNWLKVSVVLKHNRNSSVFVLINRLTQAGVFYKRKE